MDADTIKDLAIQFCTGALPYVALKGAIDEMTVMERDDFSGWVYEFAQRSASISGYVNARCALGSDRGHETAVKQMNKRRTAVRRVLTYTFPKDDIQI